MRTRQLRKLYKRSRLDVADRAYRAILFIAWEKYCHEKKINTSTN